MIAVEMHGPALRVTIDRPSHRNAMTLTMYDQLVAACDRADADDAVRVMVVTGAGGAFCAGTDIATFLDVADGDDGVAYERRITAVVRRIEAVTVPTVAAVDGVCMGGGLLIAAACDVRLAAPSARFGAPMARTVGNTLSADSLDLLVDRLGVAFVQRMLVGAEILPAGMLTACGFVVQVGVGDLEAETRALVDGLASLAPVSVSAAKRLITRRRASPRRSSGVDDEDVLRAVYADAGLHERVRRFLEH